TSVSSDTLGDRLAHLVLPAVALATTILPTVVRFTRSSMIEVLHEDYVRTAVSKGLGPRTVMTRHALRNALIPVVSAVGALVPRLIGGTVVTEAVFGWPGMGRLALEAAQGRDYPLVTGLTVVVAAIAVLASLLVDLAYTRLDPRLRLA
ncbi:MAG: ABC transporter permease, partial [Chloroflexota bacterium]|nr:ABC transporter permease [Chloroflexota bacterium]